MHLRLEELREQIGNEKPNPREGEQVNVVMPWHTWDWLLRIAETANVALIKNYDGEPNGRDRYWAAVELCRDVLRESG